MSKNVSCHRVYKSMNKPLTMCGVDRRLFFLALIIAGATFNFFYTLSGGLAMFAALYGFARWATATDPEILRILLNSSRFKRRYDPAKPAELIFRRFSRE